MVILPIHTIYDGEGEMQVKEKVDCQILSSLSKEGNLAIQRDGSGVSHSEPPEEKPSRKGLNDIVPFRPGGLVALS